MHDDGVGDAVEVHAVDGAACDCGEGGPGCDPEAAYLWAAGEELALWSAAREGAGAEGHVRVVVGFGVLFYV